MSAYFHSHLSTAASILKIYSGNEPFHLYIKKYFSNKKKFGSKDRKQIASLCYNYFRLGYAAKNISIEDKIVLGTFLCENKRSAFLENVKPKWNELIEKTLTEKLLILSSQFSIDDVFPFKDEINDGIDADKFNRSFLIQPDLFLRVRPENHNRVTGKLAGAGVSYKFISKDCIVLPNSSKIDDVIELDKEAVVQDYNSQRVGELISVSTNNNKPSAVWDCCAASGGKSIMAYDINPTIELTVSDKRESILQNLHKRFALAGIKKYHSFIADLTNNNQQLVTNKYDLIICDAPCTGSGTWARTPEQLVFIKQDAIDKYATLQKKIVEKILPSLKQNGKILYITCSVFKKENEDVIKYCSEKLGLKVKEIKLFKGYEMKSDTMFAALLHK